MKGFTPPKPKKERTLKESEKNRLIKEKRRKCQRCHNQFPVYCLEIHHKKAIHTYRDGVSLYNILTQQPKRRPAYDWKRNLIVVCAICHKKIHYQLSEKEKKKKERKKKKRQKERERQQSILGGGSIRKIGNFGGFKPPKIGPIFKPPKTTKSSLFDSTTILGGPSYFDKPKKRKKKSKRKSLFEPPQDWGF